MSSTDWTRLYNELDVESKLSNKKGVALLKALEGADPFKTLRKFSHSGAQQYILTLQCPRPLSHLASASLHSLARSLVVLAISGGCAYLQELCRMCTKAAMPLPSIVLY